MRCWTNILVSALLLGPAAGFPADQVGLITVNQAIGPATASYLARATVRAGEQKYQCLIVQLDTPGGLLESTKGIVQAFYASPVPVVVYVAPAGANAASAGCFITLAADVAAMAPNTSIGAAHPVALGGGGGAEESKPDEVMKQKLENYAASYIEAIAARHGRNVEWAKSSVVQSASITAEKARELQVIEIVARDLPDLLKQLDGRVVRGQSLRVAHAEVVAIPPLAREKFFQLLWRPEVMYLLMLVAIYGIIGELSNPGAILPGVAGTIALILALYMAAILPVNVAGVALVLLALGLFTADLFAATHGVLTAGGCIAFFLGSWLLFDRAEPAFRLSLAMIVPATVMTAAFFAFVIAAGIRAQFLPVKVGRETLLGKTALALTAVDGQGGRIFVDGAYWNAVSEAPVAKDAPVEIVGSSGLTLKVKPKT